MTTTLTPLPTHPPDLVQLVVGRRYIVIPHPGIPASRIIAAAVPYGDREWLPGAWIVRSCHRLTLLAHLGLAGFVVEEAEEP